MKTIRCIMAQCATIVAPCMVLAANFPESTGDIASNGADGWNGAMPSSTQVASFVKNSGIYTASADVAFGSVNINGLYGINFNLHESGNHTITLGAFAISADNRSATLNGGVWDFSGTATGSSNIDIGRLGPCNKYATARTTLVLANGCLATNVTSLIVSNGGGTNTFRITDSSRVYTTSALLFSNAGAVDGLLEVSSGGVLTLISGNLLDTNDSGAEVGNNRIVVTGSGSKISCPAAISGNNKVGFAVGYRGGHNSLLVEKGGEVIAPYQFHVGRRDVSHTNSVTFRTGAKFTLGATNVGEYNSCGNTLEFLSEAYGTVSGTVRVGGYTYPSSGNKMIVSNATLSANSIVSGYSEAADVSAMFDNGLVVQGDSSQMTLSNRLRIWNRSFLKFEPPKLGYSKTPITAADFYIDTSSAIEVVWPRSGVKPGVYTLVSTTGGIFRESSAIMDAANASLAVQSGGIARLVLANGNKDLVLKVSRGVVISFR